jgi:hypothetical protein
LNDRQQKYICLRKITLGQQICRAGESLLLLDFADKRREFQLRLSGKVGFLIAMDIDMAWVPGVCCNYHIVVVGDFVLT